MQLHPCRSDAEEGATKTQQIAVAEAI